MAGSGSKTLSELSLPKWPTPISGNQEWPTGPSTAIPSPWQPGIVVRALTYMFSSYLTLFPSLDGWIKQCQDFDITQIYQLNLETAQLKVLRFLPRKGITIVTMRKVTSMAL